MPASVSLLHLSDLHFTSRGAPDYIGSKGPQDLKEELRPNRSRLFLQDLESALRNTHKAKDRWPKHVLVTGDLVTGGGGEDWKPAFENA